MLLMLLPLTACSIDKNSEQEDGEASEWLGSPPMIAIDTKNEGQNMVLDTYCWEKDGETCDLVPTDPQELLVDQQFLKVTTGEEMMISMGFVEGSTSESIKLDVDRIKIIHIAPSGERKENDLGNKNFQFTAPEEVGLHYYTVILTWDNDEIKGEAIYGMKVNVKE